MDIIHASSVSVALSEALWKIRTRAEVADSRVGQVLEMPQPVMTTYYNPACRVLFSPLRDANPFFHLFESLWMLAGRNDLVFPQKFNSRFGEYSDDGKTLWGAYGWRWRKFFGADQLYIIAKELRDNPTSRRCVLSMWNGMDAIECAVDDSGVPSDLDQGLGGGKDVPCNTHAYFDTRGGKLNMTVCNRSNDAIWGAYGANAVHFSMMLEYMAFKVGIPMGVYRQFSNNLHVYTEVLDKMVPDETDRQWQLQKLAQDVETTDLYDYQLLGIVPKPLIVGSVEDFDADLHKFMANPDDTLPMQYTEPFFRDTAAPMYVTWLMYKRKEYALATETAKRIDAEDWRIAALQWLERREEKRNAR